MEKHNKIRRSILRFLCHCYIVETGNDLNWLLRLISSPETNYDSSNNTKPYPFPPAQNHSTSRLEKTDSINPTTLQ
ncbi:hypothetical protein KFK09_028138 [Dendrobium nobile]|uniref:Uncharacterized protein n=1 Tax=Dendrobium nobile TaxID=94219 RepID=A0A8T3A2R9_DENNO|nr:hypothetical protein KFK09_028138 [Dendrobium nobile]